MRLKARFIKAFVDKEFGYKVFEKDGKNYLEKDGKTVRLPDGVISIIDSVVYIGKDKIDISNY